MNSGHKIDFGFGEKMTREHALDAIGERIYEEFHPDEYVHAWRYYSKMLFWMGSATNDLADTINQHGYAGLQRDATEIHWLSFECGRRADRVEKSMREAV